MSGVTPRFLADWKKERTVEFPTTRELVKDVEFEILSADVISASVLSSFSFCLLCVIEDLTSWMHSPCKFNIVLITTLLVYVPSVMCIY